MAGAEIAPRGGGAEWRGIEGPILQNLLVLLLLFLPAGGDDDVCGDRKRAAKEREEN